MCRVSMSALRCWPRSRCRFGRSLRYAQCKHSRCRLSRLDQSNVRQKSNQFSFRCPQSMQTLRAFDSKVDGKMAPSKWSGVMSKNIATSIRWLLLLKSWNEFRTYGTHCVNVNDLCAVRDSPQLINVFGICCVVVLHWVPSKRKMSDAWPLTWVQRQVLT